MLFHFQISKLFIASIVILFFTSSNLPVLASKFLAATVVNKDGSKLDGFVHSNIRNFGELNKLSYMGDEIKFKQTLESNATKLSSKTIDQVIFHTASEPIILKYLNLYTLNQITRKLKKAKRPLWVHLVKSCDEMEVYEDFHEFDVSRKKLYLVYPDPWTTYIYIKRKNEKEATLVSTYISTTHPATKPPATMRRLNKKLIRKYFENNKEAQSIIKENLITFNVITDIFHLACPKEE